MQLRGACKSIVSQNVRDETNVTLVHSFRILWFLSSMGVHSFRIERLVVFD